MASARRSRSQSPALEDDAEWEREVKVQTKLEEYADNDGLSLTAIYQANIGKEFMLEFENKLLYIYVILAQTVPSSLAEDVTERMIRGFVVLLNKFTVFYKYQEVEEMCRLPKTKPGVMTPLLPNVDKGISFSRSFTLKPDATTLSGLSKYVLCIKRNEDLVDVLLIVTKVVTNPEDKKSFKSLGIETVKGAKYSKTKIRGADSSGVDPGGFSDPESPPESAAEEQEEF